MGSRTGSRAACGARLTMHRWRVQSGALDATVEADSAHEAFATAIREHNPESLGLIAECESLDGPVGDDTLWYCDTERTLREMGKWDEERPA